VGAKALAAAVSKSATVQAVYTGGNSGLTSAGKTAIDNALKGPRAPPAAKPPTPAPSGPSAAGADVEAMRRELEEMERKLTEAQLSSSTPPPRTIAYAVFLSYHFISVAAQFGTLLKDAVENRNEECFLDVEAGHLDLRTLLANVARSKTMVVILTEHVWTLPWCCAEVYTALKNRIPVVPVLVVGERYDSAVVADHLTFLEECLDAGALSALREVGLDPIDVAFELSCTVPSIVARKYDPTDAKAIRNAQLQVVLDTVDAAVFVQNGVAKKDWLARRSGHR